MPTAAGEIGLISSVTQAFCGDCNRARLSTEGRLFLCLFASAGHDLRALLRDGADDAHISSTIAAIWQQRRPLFRTARRGRSGARCTPRRDALTSAVDFEMTDRAALPPSLQEIASCVSGYDPQALPVAQAQDFIVWLVQPIQAIEFRPVRDAAGTRAGTRHRLGHRAPAHDNSAMDGFAPSRRRAAQRRHDAAAHRRQRPTSRAELPRRGAGTGLRTHHHRRGDAGRLDTVVPQELMQRIGEHVLVPPGLLLPGDNRRLAGEDLARGEAALSAGRLLRPADLGLLASLGPAEVPVFRRLRAAFFSTGDELRSIGEPADAGCVYDSNRYTLGMLQRLGVDAIDLGVVRDDPAAARGLHAGAACADAVITRAASASARPTTPSASWPNSATCCSGASPCGWGGRWPSAASARRRTRPPVRPARQSGGGDGDLLCLRARGAAGMAGAAPQPPLLLRAASTTALRKKPGRTEFQRGIVSRAADDRWQVAVTARSNGSGILRSMSQSQRHATGCGGAAPRAGQPIIHFAGDDGGEWTLPRRPRAFVSARCRLDSALRSPNGRKAGLGTRYAP